MEKEQLLFLKHRSVTHLLFQKYLGFILQIIKQLSQMRHLTLPIFLWSLLAASSWKCFHSLSCLGSGNEIP